MEFHVGNCSPFVIGLLNVSYVHLHFVKLMLALYNLHVQYRTLPRANMSRRLRALSSVDKRQCIKRRQIRQCTERELRSNFDVLPVSSVTVRVK